MVIVTGEARLCGSLVRELLARNVDASTEPLESLSPERDRSPVIVVAEGAHQETAALRRAVQSAVVCSGVVVYATARDLDDPAVVELRRSGVPYTIVRSSGLVDLPSETSSSFVLVPSDLDRAPFATIDDLARAAAAEIAADRVGTGAVVDVTMQAGAHAWALALRESGARAHVVPRWLTLVAGLFGVLRLEVTGARIRFLAGWDRARSARPLLAGRGA